MKSVLSLGAGALIMCGAAHATAAPPAVISVPNVAVSGIVWTTVGPRPATFTMYYTPNGTVRFTRFRWSSWGAARTTGRGRYGAGWGSSGTATMRASHIVRNRCGSRVLRFYTRLRVLSPGDVQTTTLRLTPTC